MIEHELVEKYFKKDYLKYLKYLDCLAERAEEKKFQFLGTDLGKLKEFPKPLLVKCLIIFYREMMFFPDEEIIAKLKLLGMKEEELKWFTPLHEINEAFIQINAETPITILNYFSLRLIQAYLDQKISASIFKWAKYTGKFRGKEKPIGYILIHNFFRTRYYYKKNLKPMKSKFLEEYLHKLIDSTNKITNKEGVTRRFAIDITTGKTKNIFLFLMIQTVLDFKNMCAKGLSDRNCLSYVFHLCKIIMKDEALMSVEEFNEPEEIIYEGDYRKYMAARLIKLLSLNNSKFFKNWSIPGS